MSQSTPSLVPYIFEGHPVRIRIEAGEPWFCATDVAVALGYSNTRWAIRVHCHADGVVKRATTDSMGRMQELLFVNEPNLYRLVMRSKLPSADRFERWVFERVLPQIRKSGRYEGRPLPASPPPTPTITIPQVEYIDLLRGRIVQLEQHMRVGHKPARPAWTEAEKQRLFQLLAQGLSYSQIAQQMGRPRRGIQAARTRFAAAFGRGGRTTSPAS
jgi:prophage antirepressor-like protein